MGPFVFDPECFPRPLDLADHAAVTTGDRLADLIAETHVIERAVFAEALTRQRDARAAVQGPGCGRH